MTSTTEAPVVDVAEVDAPEGDGPVRYPAGVLAHGLHAIAHHIGTYRLDYIRVESYPHAIDDRPVIEIHVDRFTIASWLDTVAIDVELRDQSDALDDQPEVQSCMVRRFVRLPDSGVRVSLLTLEFTSVVPS